jgi:hypothetical protein
VVRSLEISTEIDQITQFVSNWFGRKRVASTFTTLLDIRDIDYVPANAWELFIDAAGGTIGSTAYGGCPISFRWRWPNLWAPHKCLNNSQEYTNPQQQPIRVELSLTVEEDSDANDLIDNYFATDDRLLLELRCDSGVLIHNTPDVNHSLKLQGAFLVPDVEPLLSQNREGVNLITYQLLDVYDTVWAADYKAIVVTDIEEAP